MLFQAQLGDRIRVAVAARRLSTIEAKLLLSDSLSQPFLSSHDKPLAFLACCVPGDIVD